MREKLTGGKDFFFSQDTVPKKNANSRVTLV